VRLPFDVPDRGSRPFDVVGLGLNSIDLVTVVDTFPVPNSKQPLREFTRMPGGQIATAMCVCARLGWAASYIGTFGDDDLGALARQSLIDARVDVHASRTVPGATNQFAVVLVDRATGDRTVLWDRHAGLTLSPADVQRVDVVAGRLLVVDCHETAAAARAAEYARQAGIPTIVDVEAVRPGIHDLLRHIDAIIAAQGFPEALTGYADPGRALEEMAAAFAAPLVCVTLGAGGSLARCGGREIRTSGLKIECVDTTGAGDAFRGGFAAACLHAPDGDLEEALVYANAVAGLNCRRLGARGGLPTREEVDRVVYAKF
jgi:sugar/nucleoside kinase (ribokinase family)